MFQFFNKIHSCGITFLYLKIYFSALQVKKVQKVQNNT